MKKKCAKCRFKTRHLIDNLSGTAINLKIIPTIIVMIIPKKTPPLTPFVIRITVTKIPKMESSVLGFDKSPIPTSVASLFTIIPEVCKPIKVINKPIPAPTACFNSTGIALINFSRRPVNVNSKKNILEIKTAPSACCHGIPLPKITVYPKNAFNPRPGASASGIWQKAP